MKGNLPPSRLVKDLIELPTPCGNKVFYPADLAIYGKKGQYSVFHTISHESGIAYICVTQSDRVRFRAAGNPSQIIKLYEEIPWEELVIQDKNGTFYYKKAPSLEALEDYFNKREWLEGEQIGSGGFSLVYKTEKLINGKLQQFAKKVLAQNDEESKRRFQKEVRTLSPLNHPRIVTILDFQVINEPYYFVMPLYKGSLCDQFPNIINNLERIKKIFNNIFDGVQYLHEQGIYHRDLKPENVLINSDDDLVITDFGLGINSNSTSTRLTRTGRGMGTEIYMAPEQFRDVKNVDERADIYSLGKMIYEAFAGLLDNPYADLSVLHPAVARIVDKCTKYNRNERFQSVASLKDAFNLVLDSMTQIINITDITSVLSDILTTDNITTKHIENLSAALINIENEPDKIHDTVMKLSKNAFTKLVEYDKNVSLKIITEFTGHVTGQGWPFDYTDAIANQCKILFEANTDIDIRAKLLYCVLEVGYSHNRWYVMGLFRTMMRQVQEPGEALEIYELFKNEKTMIDRVGLERSELNPLLHRLID